MAHCISLSFIWPMSLIIDKSLDVWEVFKQHALVLVWVFVLLFCSQIDAANLV